VVVTIVGHLGLLEYLLSLASNQSGTYIRHEYDDVWEIEKFKWASCY